MQTPGGALIVVPAKGGGSRLYFEATWRHAGRAFKRRLGEAWLCERATPVDLKGWQGRYVKRSGNPSAGELTPQQATVAMRDLIAEHAAAAPTRGRPRTFREAASAWLDEPVRRPHAWRAATRRDYASALVAIALAIGDKRVDRVSAADIEAFMRALDDRASPRTVNKYRQVLGLVLADAAARGWRSGNPAVDVARRRQPRAAELTVFTVEQVEAIATAAGGELGALILVGAMTGLRRGELCALRWQDVKLDQPALHVVRAVSAGVVGRPKSGSGRVVPLARRPHTVLLELAGRERWTGPDDLVFARSDGGMRHPDAVSAGYSAARDAAGAPALRFHDLRHTFGSLLAMHGVSAFEIQAWMGHSSAATTARYMHYAPRADAAARITDALGG